MSPPSPDSVPAGTAPTSRAPRATAQPLAAGDSTFEYVWGGAMQRVFVLDGQRAWTAEDGSRIRFTSDAGQTWTFQDTPDDSRGLLESVFFLPDGLHGWAVSDDGLVLGTDSGGLGGWTILTPVRLVDPTAPQNLATLYDIRFVDEQHGWLAGLHLLKRTSDGGQTWIDVTVQDGNGDPLDMRDLEIYALAFVSGGGQQIGLASAEPGLILRTGDALGETWTAVLDIDDPAALQPHCPATANLEIWDVVFVPGTPIGAAVAYAVSGLGNGCGYIFSTKDGGKNWQQEAYVPGGGHTRAFALYGVSAFAGGGAIACGYGGMVLVRDPAQAAWRDVSDTITLPTQPLMSVGCDPNAVPAPQAWAVGAFGAIRRSQDRGHTWTEQADREAWRLLALDFPPAGITPNGATGWVAGQQYRIARTNDSGARWTEQRAEPPGSLDFGRALKAIAFADTANGVAVGVPSAIGHLPVIFFTATGGENGSWTRATLPPGLAGTEFRGVHCSGVNANARNEFWAAAANGVVLHSADGGVNWSTVPLTIVQPLTPRWNAVWFLNLATGIFVGSWSNGSAAALRIENAKIGPPTWVDVSPGISGEFTSVSADPTSGTAYAVGRAGTVYSLSRIDSVFRPVPAAMALVPAGVNLYSVAVVSVGAGYEVTIGGTRGFLLRLSGSTWTTPRSQTSLAIAGLSSASAGTGFAVGGLQEGLSVIVGTAD